VPHRDPDPRRALFALELFGIKLGLAQIQRLTRLLGHPEGAFPSVIVAGTNGKGSVSAMVERGLRAAGHHTGRYTSPHLARLEERFALDGQPVDATTLDVVTARVLDASASLPAPPSFFEATTAIAFEIFRDAAVDVAVLEVGLGGRLDATNVVSPVVAAITAIDFDHQQYLGDTLEAIAREKAGVIKPGARVVLAPNAAEVEAVIAGICRVRGAPLRRVADTVVRPLALEDGRVVMDLVTPTRTYDRLTVALRGRHQAGNAATAVCVLEEMHHVLPVDAAAIRAGVESAHWPARLERTNNGGVDVLIDGAHNPAGARALAAYIREVHPPGLPMVVGVMRDKAIGPLIDAFAAAATAFVFTAARTPRAASPADLAVVAAEIAPHVPSSVEAEPRGAIARASQLGSPVVIAGSLYLAGDIRDAL
jgi:dihydrofolate synthase/folylpolyglutamate synthase